MFFLNSCEYPSWNDIKRKGFEAELTFTLEFSKEILF